jgi:hypothetical protein
MYVMRIDRISRQILRSLFFLRYSSYKGKRKTQRNPPSLRAYYFHKIETKLLFLASSVYFTVVLVNFAQKQQKQEPHRNLVLEKVWRESRTLFPFFDKMQSRNICQCNANSRYNFNLPMEG